MRTFYTAPTLLFLACGLLACSGLLGGKDDDDDDDDDDEDTLSDAELCAQMLACAEAVDPAAAESLATTYGADGSCWSSGMEAAAACGDACEDALSVYAESYPDEPACGGGDSGDTGDTGEPPSGCPFEEGAWFFVPTDFTGNGCEIDDGILGAAYDVEITCTDSAAGTFTYDDFSFFGETMQCTSEGRAFVCEGGSGSSLLYVDGTFATNEVEADGTWGFSTSSCETWGPFTLTKD